jgi:hypothetical protein
VATEVENGIENLLKRGREGMIGDIFLILESSWQLMK